MEVYAIMADRGDYSDRIDYAVCWYPTKEKAKSTAVRMMGLSAEWCKRCRNDDNAHADGGAIQKARAAIGDPQWSYWDVTTYSVNLLPAGAP